MGSSYTDYLNTPVDVILDDLKFHSMEQEAKKIKNEQTQGQHNG